MCNGPRTNVTFWYADTGIANRLLRHCLRVHRAARLSGSMRALETFDYKLDARLNALKFRQLVYERTKINLHNTDYDRKLGVMAPLTW